MPRRAAAKGIYQRGRFWLDWDRRANGSLRSPYLAIFWYDGDRKRIRSATTGSGDERDAKAALDRHYLEKTEGAAICPTCGQRRVAGHGFLVTQAIADYISANPDASAIKPRLAHVVKYIIAAGESLTACERIDSDWVGRFRKWAAEQPMISSAGNIIDRPRTASTIENSVIALAAAINQAHRRHDTVKAAQFKSIPTKDLNNTPHHRSDIAELARMFRYASKPALRSRRGALHRFLIISIATLARPDAAHDVSTKPERRQWSSNARVLSLNPVGRRQTKKYRPVVPVAWQAALRLDEATGFYVGAASVRSAWDSMCIDLGLPGEGESGMKLIRRSMAKLLRDRLPRADWVEVEMILGHTKFDNVSDIYAPFDPNYLSAAKAEVERIIDEIESLAPGAFHRTDTGEAPNVVPIVASKKAS